MTARKSATGKNQRAATVRAEKLWGLLLAAWLASLLVIGWGAEGFGEVRGARAVRETTVVRLGAPSFEGVFFGECASYRGPSGSFEACATDANDNDAEGTALSPGSTFRFQVVPR